MDWTQIIVQALITISGLGGAWLGLRGKLAAVGRTASEAKDEARTAAGAAATAARAAHMTEQSINNRPTSMSDRFDDLHADVRKALLLVRSVASVQEQYGRDLAGIRKEIGSLREQDRDNFDANRRTRKALEDHVERSPTCGCKGCRGT